MARGRGRWLLIVTLGLSPSLRAQESKPPVFELHTVNGPSVSGPLERISEDWSLSLGETKVDGADVIALRRAQALLPAVPREQHIRFANGDCLPGNVLQVDGERLRFRPRFQTRAPLETGRELTIPLSLLSVLWFAVPERVEDAEILRRRLLTERRRRDRVLLRNGDLVEGTLSSLDEKALRIEVEANGKRSDVRIARDRVAVVALNTELTRASRPKGLYGRLVLSNGCRLSLASAHTNDGQRLTGKTLFGAVVQIPVEEIVALDHCQGRAVYLSDLEPSRYEHTPFLGVHWPYVADGSVAGRDLRLGGSTYDKGIGMHSDSRLTFNLGGAYQWFEALVGLDEKTGKGGDVVIEVLVDGKPQDVGIGGHLTGRDAPRAIRVNVAGAGELTLVVKFGRGGDVQDHVDWADARLIKK
jgi:hypothetical protein